MQVDSVSKVAFKARNPKFYEQQFANLPDNQLKNMAYNKALVDTNDKRHRRIDKAMYMSLPLVGGLTSLAKNIKFVPKKEFLGRIKGLDESAVNAVKEAMYKAGEVVIKPKYIRGYKLAGVLGNTIVWAAMLSTISAVWGAKHLMEKSSDKVKDFNQRHPLIANGSAFVASIFAYDGIKQLGAKLLKKGADKPITPETKKILDKVSSALNNSKVLNSLSKLLEKTPSALKETGKLALAFGPLIALGTIVAHSISHTRAVDKQYANNIKDLRLAQELIKEDLANNEDSEV